MNKKFFVAVTIQNYVQFYSIRKSLDELIMLGIIVDLYVPIAKDDWGLKEMFDDIYEYLKINGYSVRRNPLKRKYKILLEPYPMEYYFSFDYEYRIKYKYSAISAKPNLVYNYESNGVYDAILCYSTYEKDILSNYAKTYMIKKPNYDEFEFVQNKRKKKTLLYLPTYGELNSINDIYDTLKDLSLEYRIITKEHHGTNYFNYEIEKKNKLSLFDKCYDSKTPLEELLKDVDVVLSDNSGSIFEAIYVGVPVCIFSKALKKCSYGDIESLQYSLAKQGIIPYTDRVLDLKKIISLAYKPEIIKKQNDIRKKLFCLNDELKTFNDIIKLYLYDNINVDQIKLHRMIISNRNKERQDNIQKIKLLEKEIEKKDNLLNKTFNEKDEINNLLLEYKNGKLYKLASKIYNLNSKLRGRK